MKKVSSKFLMILFMIIAMAGCNTKTPDTKIGQDAAPAVQLEPANNADESSMDDEESGEQNDTLSEEENADVLE